VHPVHLVIFGLHEERRRLMGNGNVGFQVISLSADPEVSRIDRYRKIGATADLIGGIDSLV
jgi:hypothetical protein